MKNVITSSRMGLALVVLVIFVIASQMLPGSLAVDKGRAETAPARVNPFVTHRFVLTILPQRTSSAKMPQTSVRLRLET
jgi:biopolymer transport protein ExbD